MNPPRPEKKAPLLADPRDYILDLSASPASPADLPAPPEPSPAPSITAPSPRPFLSIHFKCCNVYHRIHPTADRSAYAGHCPRCAKPIRIAINSAGTSSRFFTAH